MSERTAICVWTEMDYEMSGCFDTTCGNAFEFTSGDVDNGFEYCPYCGGRLTVERCASDDVDPGDDLP